MQLQPDPDPDYDIFVPIIDGEEGLIPEDPETLALSRRKNPLMLGTTRDESALSICGGMEAKLDLIDRLSH